MIEGEERTGVRSEVSVMTVYRKCDGCVMTVYRRNAFTYPSIKPENIKLI